MAENHLVRCTVKDGEGIAFIGGTNSDGTHWRMSMQDAVAGMKSGKYKFYISGEGQGHWLTTVQEQGRDVLGLADEADPHLLRSLPDCP